MNIVIINGFFENQNLTNSHFTSLSNEKKNSKSLKITKTEPLYWRKGQ